MRGEPVPPFPPNNRFSPDRILFEPGLCHRPSSTLPNPQHPCYAFGPSLTLTLTSYHFLLPPREPPFVGAIVCRVSKSFLRVAQLELFAMRKEMDELVHLANYACFREFPHLLTTSTSSTTSSSSSSSSSSTSSSTASTSLSAAELQQPGPARRYNSGLFFTMVLNHCCHCVYSASLNNPHPFHPTPPSHQPLCLPPSLVTRYVEMFRCSVKGNAHLVAQWLRVGYTQGTT